MTSTQPPVDALHVARNIGGALAVHLALALNAAIAEGDDAFLNDVLDFQTQVVRSAKHLAHTRSCASRNRQTVQATRLLLTSCRLALRYWPMGTEASRTVHVHDALRPHVPWPPAIPESQSVEGERRDAGTSR